MSEPMRVKCIRVAEMEHALQLNEVYYVTQVAPSGTWFRVSRTANGDDVNTCSIWFNRNRFEILQ